MTEAAYQIYVGIDWGSQTHQVAVLDTTRRLIGERVVSHDGLALQALASWLADLAPPSAVAVAIEVPHGAVVDTLLERGIAVYALNPRQMDRFRDRYTVAGAKDDRRDAQVLAAALLTDRPAFRRLQPDDPLVVQLRELTRMEAELHEEIRRLANRVREQLLRFYPQALALCPAADEPWFWALLTLLPTPPAARPRGRPAPRVPNPARDRRRDPDRAAAPPADGGPRHDRRGGGPHCPAAAPARARRHTAAPLRAAAGGAARDSRRGGGATGAS